VTATLLRNHVGGEWVAPAATDALDVRNPATDEVLAQVPLSSAADVDVAVQAAHAAFPAWRRVPPQLRARHLLSFLRLLEEHREELAQLITTDMGKTLEDARGEVQRGIDNVETAVGIPSMMMGYGLEDGAAAGIDEQVIYQPLGVFAAICPFNFPFMIPLWFWPYAVACGNTYVIKPSEQVPLTQQRVVELVAEAGFPPGVVNLVHGGREAVDALLDHPLVRGVSFVGSTPTAAHVYARAAASGKRVQAQGGAKNALVVMPDADLDAHLANVLGSCFGAAGQRCLAGSLVLAVDGIGERVAEALARGGAAMRVGDGMDPAVDMGPVVSATARDRIVTAIGVGETDGARLTIDGRGVTVADRPRGYFVGPTVFAEVDAGMSLAADEIFGPVVGVVDHADLDAAIETINASPYGNAATIYTRDGRAAREFRYRVEAGNIGINVGVAAAAAYFPFGGTKRSFFGVLHGQGRDAARFFTESKVVIERW